MGEFSNDKRRLTSVALDRAGIAAFRGIKFPVAGLASEGDLWRLKQGTWAWRQLLG